MSEPPFLGAGRRASVLRLIDTFDEVVRTGHPQLLTLEAPPGWGKTRIVQEFYALLAEQRQGSKPHYWPLSLHEASAEGLTPPLGQAPEVRRKRTHPERFVPPAKAAPTWFWWGISATGRSRGQSAHTLLDDVVQIEAHSEALERRWREVSGRKDRLKDLLKRDESRQFGRTLGEESLGVVVETVANAAVPGLGLLTCAAELAWRRRERWANREAVAEIDTRALGQNDTLQTLAGSVGRFAAVGIPVLIIVEDLHDADQVLVDLLVAILNGPPGPVLIVGTAWPAALDDPAHEAARLLAESTPDRIGRLTADELGELNVAELTEIVQWTAPGSNHDAARRLAEHYANPLAIELASTVPRIAELLHDGEMTTEELERLPRDVEALHRAAWRSLPEDVRNALAMAALCTPQALCTSMTADIWDVRLLAPLLPQLDWLEKSTDGVRRALGGAPPANGWVRAASEWLRRFHEPLQYQLARNEAEDLYSSRRLKQLYSALVAATRTPDTIGHEEGRLLAQLRVALALVGHTEWDDDILNDLDRLLEEAMDVPSTSSQLLVIDLVRAAPHDPTDIMSLHRQRVLALAHAATGNLEEAISVSDATLPALAAALGEDHEHLTLHVRASVASWHLALGRLKEAMAQQALVVERMTELYGPFDGTVLTARATLASMRAEAGDVEAAAEELQVLSGGARTVVGERAATSLRIQLAHTLLDAGRPNEAVEHFRELVEIAPALYGPDSDFAWSARNGLGMALSMTGQPAEAVDLLLDVVAHQVESLGSRHPGALVARHNLAAAIRADGQLQRAAAEFGSLVADRTATHGPVHPQTLDARMWLATTQSSLGNHAEAIEELASLVQEHVQALGVDHPQTLAARSNHAVAIGHAGRRGEELAVLRELVRDRTRLLGRRHPHTLLSRRGLLLALIAVDQREEASRIVTDLLEDHVVTFGSGASESVQVARLNDELGQAKRLTDETSDGEHPAAEVSDAPLDVLRHMPRLDRAETPEELAIALADVERAIDRHRDAVPGSVWHEVGMGWERLTNWARAEQAYDRALERDANAATFANLCHVLLNQRRWPDVVSVGSRAHAAEDSTEVRESAATDIAFAHLKMGEATDAQEWLEKARQAGARARRIVHVEAPLQAIAGDQLGAALEWESVESWAVHADRLRHPTTHELDVAFERLRVLAAAGHRAEALKPLLNLGKHHPWSAASLVRWFALESQLVGTGLRVLERFQEQSEALVDEHSGEHRLTHPERLDDFPVGLFETQRIERCAGTRSKNLGAADEAYRLRALLRVGRIRETHDWLECDDPPAMANQLEALGAHALLVLDEAWHAGAPWVHVVSDAILTMPRFASATEPTRSALSQLARGDQVAPPEESHLPALAMDLPHLTMRLLATVAPADVEHLHALHATVSSRTIHWHDSSRPLLAHGTMTEDAWEMTLAALAHAVDLSDAPPAPSVVDANTALWWGEVMYRAQRDRDGDTYLERAISLADQNSAYQAGRNDPCPCGSGTKFKRCHGR